MSFGTRKSELASLHQFREATLLKDEFEKGLLSRFIECYKSNFSSLVLKVYTDEANAYLRGLSDAELFVKGFNFLEGVTELIRDLGFISSSVHPSLRPVHFAIIGHLADSMLNLPVYLGQMDRGLVLGKLLDAVKVLASLVETRDIVAPLDTNSSQMYSRLGHIVDGLVKPE